MHRAVLEPLRSDLAPALAELATAIGSEAADPSAFPRSIAAALGAAWAAFRAGEGRWVGPGGERAARRLDFGLLREIPRGRLVRLAGPRLERSPRFAEQGLHEVAAFLEGSAIAAVGLERPLAVEPRALEETLRAWAALASLRSSRLAAREVELRLEVGTRAASALHDVRNELTVASLELERIAALPAAGERLERARGAIAAARAICEDDPGRTTPEVRIGGILRRASDAARKVASRGAVSIETLAEEDLSFAVDRGLLGRAVLNLLLNAIEGSADGGRVYVAAELGARGELLVRVRDEGRGMSSADLEELQRFGRSGRGGWGIGTASVAYCVRRMGATYTVQSAPGSGTRVEIRVPTERPRRS